jgi:hypothetical protein
VFRLRHPKPNFRETAPIPAAKLIDRRNAAGVLADGTVVVTGGSVTAPNGAKSVLSYRYDPHHDRWTRTGDLPEPQQWVAMPLTRLRDGRLVIAGGIGQEGVATGTGGLHAFIFDSRRTTTVDAVNPDTGVRAGGKTEVHGSWDYTRTTDGTVTTLTGGHIFGNAALLADGRLFLGGGHTAWNLNTEVDTSVLAAYTHFFNPTTGTWTTGAPFPTIPGEDDRIANSHGGRANGVGFAALTTGQLVIAGGNTQTDGLSYFGTNIGRRSIMIMTPADKPENSRYQISPNPIPPSTDYGGILGDGGRNQLLCYRISHNRVVIAGGQDVTGGDLYDTYTFYLVDCSITRGPDLAHDIAQWAINNPKYPPGYQSATISTRAAQRNSALVFDDDVLVHGGGYDGINIGPILDEPPLSRLAEQLTRDTDRASRQG